jgi:hypothetical protein
LGDGAANQVITTVAAHGLHLFAIAVHQHSTERPKRVVFKIGRRKALVPEERCQQSEYLSIAWLGGRRTNVIGKQSDFQMPAQGSCYTA